MMGVIRADPGRARAHKKTGGMRMGAGIAIKTREPARDTRQK